MRLSFELDKLPENCCECPCYDAQYCVCNLLYEFADKRPANCPLKEEQEHEWIPIKRRPMDEEERMEWSKKMRHVLSDEESVIYTPLPDADERVIICTRGGWIDVDALCEDNTGCYFDKYGDVDEIVAWMPLPEPYKEENDGD